MGSGGSFEFFSFFLSWFFLGGFRDFYFVVLVYHNIFKGKLIGKYTTVAKCNYLASPARLFERAGQCIGDRSL